jgi:predicted acyltransferase
MNFSDCKFFLVMAVIGVIVYSVAYPWGWRYPWAHREVPRPNYIIVPKDYPGAKPLDQIRDK